MLNHAVMEYWSYGENGDDFGMQRNAFFTADLCTYTVHIVSISMFIL